MSDPDISIANEPFSNRMNIVNFENLFKLDNGIKSANSNKLDKIFQELSSKRDLTDNKKHVLEKLIEACKETKETSFRFYGFERKVQKTTFYT